MRALIENLGYVPEIYVWEPTRACDLSCTYCGSGAGSCRPNELSTAEALDLVAQLARLGTRLLTLSGGEPTLRHDWPELARAAVAAGLTVNLVSNGQGDGQRLADLAREVGLANVAISIDGLAATHDALRTPGAFARAEATDRQLVASGLWVE